MNVPRFNMSIILQITVLDQKRNSAREALRQLKKLQSNPNTKREQNFIVFINHITPLGTKSWVCFGNTFIKMDSSCCVKTLEKG